MSITEEILNEVTRVIVESAPDFAEGKLRLETMSETSDGLTGARGRQFDFKHAGTQRSLSLHIAVLPNRVSIFTAYIAREDAQDFSVEAWLKYHDVNSWKPSFSAEGPAPIVLACFTAFLHDMAALAKTTLAPYLTGQLWETVPIDLSPYK